MKLHEEFMFIWKVLHLDLFWNGGTRKLGNGLSPPNLITSGAISNKKAKQHPTPVDIQANVSESQKQRFSLEVIRWYKIHLKAKYHLVNSCVYSLR